MVGKTWWVLRLSSLLGTAAAACSGSGGTPPTLPPCTRGTPLSLAVGAYTAVDPGTNSGCTVFPANASAALVEYLLVPQSASGTPQDSQSFKLQGGTVAAAAIAGQVRAPQVAPAPLSPAEQFHLFLRRSERARSYPVPRRREPSAAAQRSRLAPLTITPIDSGVKDTFKVCGNLKCDTLPRVVATAQKVGRHIAIFVDDSAPPGGLTQSDLGALRAVFDTQLYEVDTTAFARESDIDSNGVVIVLMTNKINKLVTSAQCSSSGFIAARNSKPAPSVFGVHSGITIPFGT